MEGKFHAGNPAYKDDRFEHLKANLDFFSRELGRVGVTKQLLWEEYCSDYPRDTAAASFAIICRNNSLPANLRWSCSTM